MSVDREYTVQIKLTADNTGAQQASDGLKEVTKGTEGLSEATREGAKEAEHSGLSHRALHQILHLIGHEAGPAAGAALSGVAAAATGGMLFAVMAVKELFEWIQKVVEEAKRFKEAMEARLDLSGMVKGIQDVKLEIEKTTTSVDDFFEKLKRKAEGENGFKKLADEQIAHLKRVAEAEKQLADAEASREKDHLDYLKATHQISDVDYKYAMEAVNNTKSEKQSSISGKLESQSEAALSQALTNILAREEAAKGELNQRKGQPNAEKRLDTLKNLFEAAQKQMDDLQKLQTEGPSYWGAALVNNFTHPTETFNAFQQRIRDELAAKMADVRGYQASLRAQIEELRKNTSSPEKIKELEDRLTGLQSDQEAIQHELSGRADQGAINKDRDAADRVHIFLEAQNRLLQNQGTSADSGAVAAMNQLLQNSKQSDQRMFLLLKDLIQHHGDLAAALAELHSQLKDTQSRTDRPPS